MSELLGIARFRFLEGKRDEYLRLSDQASEIVRTTEPGTLAYDLYLNGDQSECMFIERYRGAPRPAFRCGPVDGLGGSRRAPRRAERRAPGEVGRQRRAGPLHSLPVDEEISRYLSGASMRSSSASVVCQLRIVIDL